MIARHQSVYIVVTPHHFHQTWNVWCAFTVIP